MSDYLVYDPKYVPRAFGLNNTGAICWFNSLMQSLLSCPALTRYMLENEAKFADNRMASEYIRVLKLLFDVDDKGCVIKPVDAPPTMIQCASTMVLNGLMHEIKNNQKGKKKKPPCGQEGVQDYFNDFMDLLNEDGVTRLFNNKYEYLICCDHCKHILVNKRSTEKDLFVDMDCGRSFADRNEFQSWITAHATEIDEYKCEKCGQKSQKILRMQHLCLLREVVVVFFKWIRRNSNFWYPQHLQFKCKDGGHLTYKVVAQIEHVGYYNPVTHTSSGHYYARGLRERVYEFNDLGMRPAETTPTSQTHVVFYHLMPRNTVLTTDEKSPHAPMATPKAPTA